MKHAVAGTVDLAIMFHESSQTTGHLKHRPGTVWGVSDDFKRVEANDCPMSTCAVPAGSPCRTGKGKVAARYHPARFRLVLQLAKALNVPTPALRKPGSAWTELPRPVNVGVEPVGHVRIGYARALVVHEHKRLGRGIELATLAEELKASDVGLEFLTGDFHGPHDPSGIVFTVLAALSGSEREYIRDRTLAGHECARTRGRTIGGASVADPDMPAMALHLREQELSLRDIAAKLVITTGKKKGQHPSPATVMRMLREHDEQTVGVGAQRGTTSGPRP